MLKKILINSSLFIAFFAVNVNASDTESIYSDSGKPVATKNQFGSDLQAYSQLEPDFKEEVKKQIKKGGKVLELGCGYGRTAFSAIGRLKKPGKSFLYVMSDIGKEHIESCENYANKLVKTNKLKLKFKNNHLRFECEDALEQLKCSSSKSFDVIYASNLIHFFTPDKIRKFLELSFKTLAPGGKLFLITSSPYSDSYNWKGLVKEFGGLEKMTTSGLGRQLIDAYVKKKIGVKLYEHRKEIKKIEPDEYDFKGRVVKNIEDYIKVKLKDAMEVEKEREIDQDFPGNNLASFCPEKFIRDWTSCTAHELKAVAEKYGFTTLKAIEFSPIYGNGGLNNKPSERSMVGCIFQKPDMPSPELIIDLTGSGDGSGDSNTNEVPR